MSKVLPPFLKCYPMSAIEFDAGVRQITLFAVHKDLRLQTAKAIASACGATSSFVEFGSSVTGPLESPHPAACTYVPEILDLSLEDQLRAKQIWRSEELHEGLLILATGASNDRTREAIIHGKFREDLFYFLAQAPAIWDGN